ncbi:DNA sulfur modification protein DndB [Robertmurraya siralis]|uniref:DNA sulfur modification protein DndB n=1 Tax=Robertmurraya siralis TaxID=77777 RepID=UPI0010F867EA|nr:DNA sulfur modification protein DndB [Robertmurraya siralis]
MKNKEKLVEHLIDNIQKIKRDKSVISDIKLELANKYDILAGDVQEWINKPEDKLNDLDIRELYLFAEQIYLKTGNVKDLSLELYFTDIEKDMARKYEASLYSERLSFPITLSDARVIEDGVFAVLMDIKTINELVNNQLLIYDYEIQREAVLVKGKDGSIRKKPKIVKKNVDEITEHLLKGTLSKTAPPLIWNALPRSGKTGDELYFDPAKQELTILEGTELAIGDGFHRINGIKNALMKNTSIERKLLVYISNMSKKLFRAEMAQLAKATPISTVRVQEWESKRYSDSIVQQLKLESDLKDRISQTNRIKTIANELVSYNILADTIDEEFDISNRAESYDVGDFLVEYFNVLVGAYSEDFLDNPSESRKISLLVDNNMFVGYVTLAARLYKKGIKPREVRKIIRQIDFSRTNPLWRQIGIINSEGKIERDTVKIRKNIKKYFKEIDIESMVNS